MNPFLSAIERTLAQRRLLARGQGIVVAVSGGVDSMVLLQVLQTLAPRYHWRLVVAHFNHRWRGAESDADEHLVAETARKLGLDFVVERAAAAGPQSGEGLSLEMTARQLRHEFLARTARATQAISIALAHQADDQVELFFLRLLRGAGGSGLAGMLWESPSPAAPDLHLVRPLLAQPKSALLAFARQERIPWREDASNLQLDFLRNRVRRRLLPLLVRQYQPGLAKTILRVMEIVGVEADYVSAQAQAWLKHAQPSAFERLHLAVRRRCLYEQLLASGIEPDFDLVDELCAEPRRTIMVSPTLTVSRDSAGRLECRRVTLARFNPEERRIDLRTESSPVAFGKLELRWKFCRLTSRRPLRPAARPGQELFDADKTGSLITLRHWQPGDRFQPLGLPGPAKLQDLFLNRKIPRAQRPGLTVAVAETGGIFWVEGLRISELAKLEAGSRRGLKWEWALRAGKPDVTMPGN